MERNLESSMGMDHLRDCSKNFYNSMEPRSQRLIPTNHMLFHDPSTTIGSGTRPPEVNIATGLPPGMQYSTTGEEFDFEFMRERVNSWQRFIPNSSVCPGAVVGYTDHQVGSEGGSSISVPPSVELNHEKEFNQKHSFHTVETVSYQDARPLPQILSQNDINRKVRGYASWGTSDCPSTKIKFLCSFAGKVLPRPSDGKLRYVGGQTRIIQIKRNILWQELMQKALSVYDKTRLIKYQLPGEDLDALVSVSCDEDLQNMMEECSSIEDDGSHKPRMFLLSASDMENNQFSLVNLDGNSEVYYVVAVNGMNLAPPKNAVVLKSNSQNTLDELFSLKVDRGPLENVSRSAEARNMPSEFTELLTNTASSQSMPPGSSCHYESNSVNGQSTMMLKQIYRKDTFPDSVASQTNDFHGGGQLIDKIPFSAIVKPTDRLHLSEKPLHGGSHLQDSEASEEEALPKKICNGQRVRGAVQVQLMEKEVSLLEERSFRENPSSKNGESERVQAFDNNFGAASQELFSSDSKAGVGVPSMHVRVQDCAQKPESFEAVTKGTGHNSHEQDVPLKSGESKPNHVDATASPLEPPVLPKRVFHSEWIPREQAESNRLSKSDDSFGTQFVMSHLQAEITNPITELADNPSDENIFCKAGYPISAAEPLSLKPRNFVDGMAQTGAHKEWVSDASMMNYVKEVGGHDSNCQKVESKCEIPTNSGMERLVYKDNENSRLGVSVLTNMTSKKSLSELETECPQDKEVGFSNGNQNGGQLDPLSSARNETEDITAKNSSAGVGASAQGGILIDINDRFPQNFLADISSVVKNSQGLPGFSALATDGTGMSVNIENHEPSRWSYFRNLVQDDFVRKDVSLIENHLGFSSPYAVNGEASVDYRYPPLKPDSLPQFDSHLGFDKSNQRDQSGLDGTSDLNTHLNFDTSEVEDNSGLQSDAISNKHAEESKCEDSIGFVGTPNAAALFGHSLGDFDISTLQIIKNEDLEELKELGSGTFGTVYHGKWRGTDVAIKRIKKSCFIGRSSEQERLTFEFWREAAILSKLHHPNVVAFYGVVQDRPGGTLATVTEFMVNGSLSHVLMLKDKHLDYRKRLLIAMDAAFGMEYLHERKIIHFDLKCDNLLVNLRDPLRPICKVGDFGLSKIRRNTLVTGGLRGTLPWMAPELLNGSSTKVSEKVDVFSFGIVLWEILTGEEPYANMHYGAIIGGIVHNTLRPLVPSTCDAEWRALMEQCWAPDAVARPSFKEIAKRLRAMSDAAQSKPPPPPQHNQPARSGIDYHKP